MSAPARSAFSYPQFRTLIVVATVSYLGTFVQEIGERWLILELTKSPLPSAMMATVFVLSALVATLPAGILADRMSRRVLAAISQGVSALVAAVMALLAYTGHVTPAALMLGAGFLGLAMALGAPAWTAFFSELLPRDKIAEGIAANAVAFNVARAVGPAVGGVVLDTYGPSVSFALNAASFAAGATVVMRMRKVPYPRVVVADSAPMSRAFAEPMRVGLVEPGIRSIFLSILLVSVSVSIFYALAPAYGKTTLRATPLQYGVMIGMMGMGAVLASLLLKPLRQRVPPRFVIGCSLVLYAAATVGLAAVDRIPFAIALFLPAGIAWIATFSSMTTLLQVWSRDALRGRLMAVYMMCHLAAWAVGATLGGVIAKDQGVRIAIVFGGLLCFAAGLVVMRLPLPPSFAGPPDSIPPPPMDEAAVPSVR